MRMLIVATQSAIPERELNRRQSGCGANFTSNWPSDIQPRWIRVSLKSRAHSLKVSDDVQVLKTCHWKPNHTVKESSYSLPAFALCDILTVV